MGKSNFDEKLSFMIPENLVIDQGTDDEGNSYFHIKNRVEKSDDNSGEPEYTAAIKKEDEIAGDKGFSLEGNVKNQVFIREKEMSMMIFTLRACLVKIFLEKDNQVYSIFTKRVFKKNEGEEKVADWLEFVNQAIRISSTPRFFRLFMMDSQNLALSFSPTYIPKTSFLPDISIPMAM